MLCILLHLAGCFPGGGSGLRHVHSVAYGMLRFTRFKLLRLCILLHLAG